MGNSNSAPRNDVVLDSRVIKISESVARRLLTNQGDSSAAKTPPPQPRPQSFREDGNYVDEAVFQEFQKQEIASELQMRSLSTELEEAAKPFSKKVNTKNGSVPSSSEQEQLLECFAKNPDLILRCHQEVLDFTSYVKQQQQR